MNWPVAEQAENTKPSPGSDLAQSTQTASQALLSFVDQVLKNRDQEKSSGTNDQAAESSSIPENGNGSAERLQLTEGWQFLPAGQNGEYMIGVRQLDDNNLEFSIHDENGPLMGLRSFNGESGTTLTLVSGDIEHDQESVPVAMINTSNDRNADPPTRSFSIHLPDGAGGIAGYQNFQVAQTREPDASGQITERNQVTSFRGSYAVPTEAGTAQREVNCIFEVGKLVAIQHRLVDDSTNGNSDVPWETDTGQNPDLWAGVRDSINLCVNIDLDDFSPPVAKDAASVDDGDDHVHSPVSLVSEDDGEVDAHADAVPDADDGNGDSVRPVAGEVPRTEGTVQYFDIGLALAIGQTQPTEPAARRPVQPGDPVVSGEGPFPPQVGGPGGPASDTYWGDDLATLSTPPAADLLRINGNVGALLRVPMEERHHQWCDTATDTFLRNGDPASRQAILQEILRSVPHVQGDDQSYLNAFLQLSRIDSARRMQEATTPAERSQAARDFVMFNNLLTRPGLSGQVLMDAVKNLPRNPNGNIQIAGNGSGFVRGALGDNGVTFEQTAHPPSDLPQSIQNIFQQNPGLWDSAQRDVAQTQIQRDQQYRDIVGNILRPGSTVTTDQLPAQLQALQELNSQSFQRYQATVADLEVLTAARILNESNNMQEVQRAIQTINSSSNPMARGYQTILGREQITNPEQLAAFRQRSGDALIGQISQDRNKVQVRFLEEPLRQQVVDRPVDRPSAEFLENLQTQLRTELERGNQHAADTLDWVNAQLLLSRIGTAGSRAAAGPIATELIQSINRPDGTVNQHALSAAISLVGSAGTTEQWLQRRQLEPGSHNLPSFYTGLGNNFDLPMAFRNQVASQLRETINGLPSNVHLTPVQLHTLAMGLQRPHGDQTTEPHFRNEYRQTVEEILRRQLRMPEGDRNARINAVADAMISGVTGLGTVMMEADATTLQRMLPHLEQLGKEGSRDAMILLSAMASNTIAGDSAQARRAGQILSRVAAQDNGRNLNVAIEAVSHTIQQRGDRGTLLEVLGNLSFLTGTPNFDTSLLLSRGYINSYDPQLFPMGPTQAIGATDYTRTPLPTTELTASQRQEHRLSAAFAMLADPRHINDVSISTITNFMTREMATALHEAVGTFSREQRDQFMNNLRDNLRVPANWTAESIAQVENRLIAFQAFGAFGWGPDVRMLGDILNLQVQDNNPLAQQLRQMQQTGLETMVSMLNSPDEHVRRGVLDRLESQAWPPHLFPTFRNAINDLVQNAQHLTPAELRRATTMIPGNNSIRPPFSVLLHQMGVGDSRQVGADILARVQNADELTNYTLPILTAAAAFNQLTPTMRSTMRSMGDLPGDTTIDVNQIARALARGEHTPEMDFLLAMGTNLHSSIESHTQRNQELLRQATIEQQILTFGSQPGDRTRPNPDGPLPQDISQLAPGPRAHALALSELHRLEREEQQWRQAELDRNTSDLGSSSVIASTVAALTLPDSPQAARIRDLRQWLERHERAGYVLDHERFTRRMGEIGGQLTGNVESLTELRVAEATLAYQQFRVSGQNETADRILLNLWSNNQLPEGLQNDFNRMWQRMAALGAAPTREIPNFHGTPEEQLRQAVAVLNAMPHHTHSDPTIAGLESTMRASIEHRAQVIVMNQPAAREVTQAVNQYRANADNLQLYFQIVAATQDGRRDESLIAHLRQSSTELRNILGANGQPARDNMSALMVNLRNQMEALPADAPARAMYQRMIESLNNAVQPITPDTQANRQLTSIVNGTLDGGSIQNREWYVRAGRDLVRFGIVTAACAGSQVLCELIPYAGHFVSMVVVPAVATASNHIVDEGLYQLGLQDNGSFIVDAAAGRQQYDPISMSHYSVTGGQVGRQLWQQYRGEFEMNAAAGGIGWVGGRIGQGVGGRLGLPTVAHAAPANLASRFARNLRSGIGPGIAMSSVGFVDQELHLNLPTALLGLAVAGGHGFYGGLTRPRSNDNLQRFLPDHSERQPTLHNEQHIAAQRSQTALHVDQLMRRGTLTEPVAENLLRLMRDGQLTPSAVRAAADLPANLRTQHIDSLLSGNGNSNMINNRLLTAWQSHLETTHPTLRPTIEQLRSGNQLSVDMLRSLHSLTPEGVGRLTALSNHQRGALLSSISSLPRESQNAFLQHVTSLSETQTQRLSDMIRALPDAQVRESVARGFSENRNPQTLANLIDAVHTLPQNQQALALSDAAHLPGSVQQSLNQVTDHAARGRLLEVLGSAARTAQGRPGVERFGEMVCAMPADAQARLLESLGGITNSTSRGRTFDTLLSSLDGSNAASQSVNRFLTGLSSIQDGPQRLAMLNTLGDLPPQLARDLVRSFGHYGDATKHQTFLQELAAMPNEARSALLNGISSIQNAETRFAVMGATITSPVLRQALTSASATEMTALVGRFSAMPPGATPATVGGVIAGHRINQMVNSNELPRAVADRILARVNDSSLPADAAINAARGVQNLPESHANLLLQSITPQNAGRLAEMMGRLPTAQRTQAAEILALQLRAGVSPEQSGMLLDVFSHISDPAQRLQAVEGFLALGRADRTRVIRDLQHRATGTDQGYAEQVRVLRSALRLPELSAPPQAVAPEQRLRTALLSRPESNVDYNALFNHLEQGRQSGQLTNTDLNALTFMIAEGEMSASSLATRSATQADRTALHDMLHHKPNTASDFPSIVESIERIQRARQNMSNVGEDLFARNLSRLRDEVGTMRDMFWGSATDRRAAMGRAAEAIPQSIANRTDLIAAARSGDLAPIETLLRQQLAERGLNANGPITRENLNAFFNPPGGGERVQVPNWLRTLGREYMAARDAHAMTTADAQLTSALAAHNAGQPVNQQALLQALQSFRSSLQPLLSEGGQLNTAHSDLSGDLGRMDSFLRSRLAEHNIIPSGPDGRITPQDFGRLPNNVQQALRPMFSAQQALQNTTLGRIGELISFGRTLDSVITQVGNGDYSQLGNLRAGFDNARLRLDPAQRNQQRISLFESSNFTQRHVSEAYDIAWNRLMLQRRLTQSGIQETPSSSRWDIGNGTVNGVNQRVRIWEAPAVPGTNQRPLLHVPLTGGEVPLSQAMQTQGPLVLDVIGQTGHPVRVTIPPNATVRLSGGANAASGEAGLVFRVPNGPDRFSEYRVMPPRDYSTQNAIQTNFANGYFRMSEVLVVNGQEAIVYRGANGQPMFGVDGNPWLFRYDDNTQNTIVHINELRGIPLTPAETNARNEMNERWGRGATSLRGYWQAFTHFHLAPTPHQGTPTVAPTVRPARP